MGTYAIIYIEYKKKDKWEWVRFTPHNSDKERSYLVKQGIIRDLIRDSYWEYSRRGLPNDVTEELKAYIKEESPYGYSTTYVDLKEFENYCDNIITEYSNKLKDELVIEKLDKIISLIDSLDKKKVKNKAAKNRLANDEENSVNNTPSGDKEDADEEDDFLYYNEEIQDIIDDYRFVKEFITSIYNIVDMYDSDVYPNYEDIRLIMYCE